MPFLFYILLLAGDLVSGYGVLTLFRIRMKTAYMITLSLLLGVAIQSVVPFVLQLLFIPLTRLSVFGTLLLVALLLNGPSVRRIRLEGWPAVRASFKPGRFRVLPYEVPFMLVFLFMALVSIWRCYYLPPTSRDALSGPEAIAQFALREHTMINSFFHIDLSSTNNQFKSPFLISLQLIYKMAGFPFGQVWLSIVFVSFTVFLYHAVRERQHPVIAGLLLLLFLMTPEVYAYTFMILYDYSNMVYFFLSIYFLVGYFRNRSASWFWLSGLFMGIATYIRSETLVLALLFLPVILFVQRRGGATVKKMAWSILFFYVPPVLFYYLAGPLWLNHYLPVRYDIGDLINRHLTDPGPLFQRYSDIVDRLIASSFGIHLWIYFFFIGATLFVAEVFAPGRFNKDGRNWLYAVLVVYLGLGALGFVLPLMDLNDSTKRGLFKMLPLVLLYMANNAWLIRLSGWITRWEAQPAVAGAQRIERQAPAVRNTPKSNIGKRSPAGAPSKKGSGKKRRK